MVDDTSGTHGEKSQSKSDVIDKTSSNTGGCEEKSNDSSDAAKGSNNTSDAAVSSNKTSDASVGNKASDAAIGSNSTSDSNNTSNVAAVSSNTSDAAADDKTEKKQEAEDEKGINPDDPLLRSPSGFEDRVKALFEKVLAEKEEFEHERRGAQKAAKEFSSDRVIKGKFLQPIYDDNGEIVGYKNPLHIGHLDLRVGELRKVSRHPNPSKQCGYTETVAINPHIKKPKYFFGSQEDIDKIKEERNLVVESGIPKHYSLDDLCRNKVVVLCNVKPFKSRGVDSKVVVLCAKKGEKIELLQVPGSATTGDPIIVRGYPKSPQSPYVINIFKNIGDDLRVNKDRQLVYKDKPLKVEATEGYITANTLSDCCVSNVMGYDFI